MPLGTLAVNEPTEKELAAAKAARIRLGYEKADPCSHPPPVSFHSSPRC